MTRCCISRFQSGVAVSRLVQARELNGRLTRFCFTSWSTHARYAGLSNPVPTVNTSYLNEEEFLAIVVTNVYVSAKGGTKFRANHFDDIVRYESAAVMIQNCGAGACGNPNDPGN